MIAAALALLSCAIATAVAQPRAGHYPELAPPEASEDLELIPPPQLTEADRERRARAVARIGEIVVTVGDIEDRLRTATTEEVAAYATPEGRQRIVDGEITRAVLAFEAERQGLLDRDVRRVTEEALVHALLEDGYHASLFAPPRTEVHVTPASPEERFAYVLFAPSRAEAASLHQRLSTPPERAADRLVPIEGFDEAELTSLANEVGAVSGAPHPSGMRGWVALAPRAGDEPLAQQARDALFSLPAETGATSDPVRVGSVYAVVRVLGVRAAEPERPDPGARVRLAIERRDAAIAELLESLRAQHLSDHHPERLSPANLDFRGLP